MVFFNKPAGGPDSVGGVWPWTQIAVCRNRSGGTLSKGEVCQLAFAAGNHEATEIATNDSNSYRPGASNDTSWNTVVNPHSNAAIADSNGIAGIRQGGIFGVALEDVADDADGEFQFFGLVEDAYVVDTTSGDGAQPGQLLGVTATNSFRCHVGTNAVIVGFYADAADTTLTNRALKRVFLTQGLGCAANGAQVAGIVRS
jgi:hypothetical protein